jgi:radical SAM protein with 4Fe4S-binding SPASM domain
MKDAPLVLTRQHFGCLVFERSTSRYLPFDGEATEALVALASSSLPEVLATTSPSKREGIEALVDAFAPRGFFTVDRYVVFRPLYPAGAARLRIDLMPSFDQYSEALRQLSDLGGSSRGIDPFSPQARLETSAVVQGNHGCAAGNTIATISARGDVNPCSFLGSSFDVANICERSFGDIWRNGDGFRAMRARSVAPQPGQFNGACRARAFQMAGDVDAADPWQAAWELQQRVGVPPGFTLPVGGLL